MNLSLKVGRGVPAEPLVPVQRPARQGHRAPPSIRSTCWILGLVVGLLPGALLAKVIVTPGTYRGWPGSFVLDNGKAFVVVVPSIGRIMQFGFKSEEGVFWENPKLYGQLADMRLPVWAAKDWINFGGDKAWPSPEGDWEQFTGRKGWRPPPAFDGMAYEGQLKGNDVVLISFVDPFYGVKVHRRVELHPSRAELTITTTFKHVQGEPLKIGIWIVTQLREPTALFAPLPRKSIFPDGFTSLGNVPPPSLVISNRLLSLSRSTNQSHKIGLDADRLLWVGEKHTLLIESPRTRGADYPDRGSNTEIYTSPDPLPYIELETLGPLRISKSGDTIKHRDVYILGRRQHASAEAEARAILRR